MPTLIEKSPDVGLANLVTLRVTPLTVDAALERSLNVDAALERSLNVDASALMTNEDSLIHAG